MKLWLYFILFAAALLSALWLMQVVFLQSFYEGMKTRETEQVAEKLGAAYGQADFDTVLEQTAFANSILVYVIDSDGNIVSSTDEHGPGKPAKKGNRDEFFRPLPDDYDQFTAKLSQSATGRVSYTAKKQNFRGKSLVCGVALPGASLYVSTPLDPVNSTTSILRTQLIYVTFAALILSFVLAYFISRRFARPIASLTGQAKKLAEGEFPEEFDKGFCSELDGLSDTLSFASAELSKVEKLRRELIANISHDLRTPLTMIKAYTEMIRDISGDNKEKREAHLGVIASETDRLTGLVNDILALSSIQSGNERLTRENVNLSELVKKILSRFDPIFSHEGYAFKTAIEPDQYVSADAQKIEQVLYNLIGNAMNYIGDDKLIAVNVRDLGGWARVEITDHGDGILEDELAHIWDRYYRSSTHKRGQTGAGLGLSIVKGILGLHEARFGVDSCSGQGSSFWFELKK